MTRADAGTRERFDRGKSPRASRGRRRSCRRAGRNRCESRRGWAAAFARGRRGARRYCPRDRSAVRGPAARIKPMTYVQPAISASEYATRLTPSANAPPAGRPNSLNFSSRARSAASTLIDESISRSAGRARPRQPRSGRLRRRLRNQTERRGGECADECASSREHDAAILPSQSPCPAHAAR